MSDAVDKLPITRPRALRGSLTSAFAVLGGVQFVMILAMSMLSACLSSIQASLHTPTPTLSLLTAAYGMSFAGLLLLGGAVVDLGRARRVLTWSLTVFVIGTTLSAFAPTTAVLLAGRVVQGGGAAFAVPAALALVGVIYPDPSDRDRAMAIWGVLSGLGGIAGLLYGGLIGAALSWRWTFAVPAVLAVAAVASLPLLIPDTPPTTGRRLDYLGAVAATIALGAASYALVIGPQQGWRNGTVIGWFTAAAVAAVICVLAEAHATDPLVPARLFRSVPRDLALVTVFLASTAVTTAYFMLAVHFQQVLGWNEVVTAIGFLPIGVVLFGASLAMSRIIAKINPAAGLPIGTGIAALGLWLTGTALSADDYLVLLPGLIVLPIGVAIMFATSTAVGMTDMTESTAGRAGGLLNALMEAGPTFGLAAIVSFATAVATTHTAHPTPAQTSNGFAIALQIAGAVYLVVAVLLSTGLAVTWRNNRNRKGSNP